MSMVACRDVFTCSRQARTDNYFYKAVFSLALTALIQNQPTTLILSLDDWILHFTFSGVVANKPELVVCF